MRVVLQPAHGYGTAAAASVRVPLRTSTAATRLSTVRKGYPPDLRQQQQISDLVVVVCCFLTLTLNDL